MLARLARYLERRWEFREYLADLRDTRQNPQIPTSAVVLSIFAMHALRLDLSGLRAMLGGVGQEMKRKKVFRRLY